MAQLGVTSSLSGRLKQIERFAKLIDQPSVSSQQVSYSSSQITSDPGAGQLINVKT